MAAANNTSKIVVSYRCGTFCHVWGVLLHRLVERFGQNSLFIDIDNIPFGGDFRTDALTSSDLLVAVIGREWLGRRENAPARIMNAADPVRVEIETAMRSSVPILLVLIDGAMMPDPEQLPDSIKEFAFLNELTGRWGFSRQRPRRSKSASARCSPSFSEVCFSRRCSAGHSGSCCGSGPRRKAGAHGRARFLQRALSRHRRGAHAIHRHSRPAILRLMDRAHSGAGLAGLHRPRLDL